jgi:hypothetical protein
MKIVVTVCLVLMTYGVLYHNLPCWAQLLDKTMYCQIKESGEKARVADEQFRKAHHGKDQFQVELENMYKKMVDDVNTEHGSHAPSARVYYEVCVSFNGRRNCRLESAVTQREAVRRALSNSCALLASGVTETTRCENTKPDSVSRPLGLATSTPRR